tara:strand:- start:426 stop:1181 length:756 start_codon:yes stop_codon:yes gene_type:complete
MATRPPPPPKIFSDKRRLARRQRMLAVTERPSFLADLMAEEIIERLAFLRHEPGNPLVIGDAGHALARTLPPSAEYRDISGPDPIDLERPLPSDVHDLIAVFGLLDTVNDLPGALIHLKNALVPGGLIIASFPGAGSLPRLRQIMLAADGDRPAARIHPLVDNRAAAGLLQRAGWADPVVDSYTLRLRYSSLMALVRDVRALGLGNVLANTPPPLGKAALARAETAFTELADKDGRLTETLEILTLTGRRK